MFCYAVLHTIPISSMQTCMIDTIRYAIKIVRVYSCWQATGLPSILHTPTTSSKLNLRPHLANAVWAELREHALCSLRASRHSLSCELDSTTSVYNGRQSATFNYVFRSACSCHFLPAAASEGWSGLDTWAIGLLVLSPSWICRSRWALPPTPSPLHWPTSADTRFRDPPIAVSLSS